MTKPTSKRPRSFHSTASHVARRRRIGGAFIISEKMVKFIVIAVLVLIVLQSNPDLVEKLIPLLR